MFHHTMIQLIFFLLIRCLSTSQPRVILLTFRLHWRSLKFCFLVVHVGHVRSSLWHTSVRSRDRFRSFGLRVSSQICFWFDNACRFMLCSIKRRLRNLGITRNHWDGLSRRRRLQHCFRSLFGAQPRCHARLYIRHNTLLQKCIGISFTDLHIGKPKTGK